MAALLDMLILGFVGMGLGMVFADNFADAGRWGFLIGLVISGIYFSVLNSYVGSGQTLGKRILKIRVVDNRGNEVGLDRTLPRFLLLYLPYFLNGQVLPAGILLNPIGVGVLSLLVVGMLLSNLYLLVFNRPARVGVHDIATSTRVVSVPHQTQTLTSAWKGHIPVVVFLMVIASALPTVMPHFVSGMIDSDQLEDLANLHLEIEKLNNIKFVSVQDTISSFNDSSTTKSLHAILVVKKSHISDTKAKEACKTILREFPHVLERDWLYISFMHGYDIGIAKHWNHQNSLRISIARAEPNDICSSQPRSLCGEEQLAGNISPSQSCAKS